MCKTAPAPWKSISDMLIQNKCWLCTQTFPRGKKKKVFTVHQILQAFSSTFAAAQENDESNSERLAIFTDFNEQLPHLYSCYSHFHSLGGDLDRINGELSKLDIALWMSGLVCSSNDLCKAAYTAISTEDDKSIGSTEQLKAAFAKHNVTDCPPDCGCDNPWQFMAM